MAKEEENKDKYNKVQPQANVQVKPKEKVKFMQANGVEIDIEPDTVTSISKFGSSYAYINIMNDYMIMVKGTILSVAEQIWKGPKE